MSRCDEDKAVPTIVCIVYVALKILYLHLIHMIHFYAAQCSFRSAFDIQDCDICKPCMLV